MVLIVVHAANLGTNETFRDIAFYIYTEGRKGEQKDCTMSFYYHRRSCYYLIKDRVKFYDMWNNFRSSGAISAPRHP